MFCSKRLWWAVIVFLFSIYTPTKAHAVKVDPYQYKTITGRVSFEYERTTLSYAKGSSASYYSFTEDYTLDSKAYLLNRLLIIYDAGVSYSRQLSGYAGSKSGYDSKGYYLSTTFIPKSLIPLTLRTRKTISDYAETTDYGLIWLVRFRGSLPYTSVSAERNIEDSSGYVQEDTEYRVDMRNELGPSKNEFRYTLSEADNSTQGTTNTNSAMSFSNRTKISRNTKFYFGAARGESSSSARDKKNINEGLTASFSSSPGKEFSQEHSYSFARTERKDSSSDNNNYSGSMRYRLSRRLSSSLSLQASSSDSDSLTTKVQSDTLSTTGKLNYALSRKFSLTEKIDYREYQTSSSGTGASNLSDSSRLQVDTSINYRTKLSWASLGAGYSAGLLQEKRTGDTRYGSALRQSFSISLGGMDALGYATVNASGRHSYAEPISGAISDRSTTFSLNARNKAWKEYVSLIGSYTGTEEKSWIGAGNRKNDLLLLEGLVLYFKTVRIKFNAKMINTDNEYQDKSTITSKGFSIKHARRLYNGDLTAQMAYSDTNSDVGDTSQRSTGIQFNATYTRWLLGRIPWMASLDRSHQTTEGRLTVDTTITNLFKYQLRAWTLSAQHDYTLREYLESRSAESRILLKASRMFMWRKL